MHKKQSWKTNYNNLCTRADTTKLNEAQTLTVNCEKNLSWSPPAADFILFFSSQQTSMRNAMRFFFSFFFPLTIRDIYFHSRALSLSLSLSLLVATVIPEIFQGWIFESWKARGTWWAPLNLREWRCFLWPSTGECHFSHGLADASGYRYHSQTSATPSANKRPRQPILSAGQVHFTEGEFS